MIDYLIALEKLKELVVSDEKLKSLGSSEIWMDKDYKIISNLISENIVKTNLLSEAEKRDIGTTISAITLKRFFKYGYKISNPIEKRQLRTLQKLCVFKGYKNWNVFIEDNKELFATQISDIDIKKIILKGNKAEFDAYYSVPNRNTEQLSEFFIEDGAAYQKIIALINRAIEKRWIINDINHPSYYKVIELNVIGLRNGYIEVKTREHWYLRWVIQDKKKVGFVYNELNEQNYFLKRNNGKWKIELNYYTSPNASNLIN